MEGRFLYVDDGFASETSENQHSSTTYLNLPRDLSLANRKNFAMTSKKGVPLVYHCKLTILRPLQDDTNVGLYTLVGTAQKNWVTRNASVKLHYARENMFKKSGIKRSERGRYDSTIRLVFDSASQTWEVPSFNDGSSLFTASGSEWDNTQIAIDQDSDLVPALFGSVVDEGSSISAGTFNIQNAYLNSRRKPPLDDVLPAETSAAYSIIRALFKHETPVVVAAVSAMADSNQDLTPYDTDAAAGTFSSIAIAGILELGNMASTSGTMFVDIPFGICQVIHAKQTQNNSDGSMEGNVLMHVEVLGFSELEG